MANYIELDIEDIAEWPRVVQIIVIALLAILIQIVGYWLYLQPYTDFINELRLQEQQLKSTAVIKAQKVARLPKLQAQLDNLAQRYDDLSRLLPAEKELASMLASVNEVGLKNSLAFTRMDWGEKQNQPFLYRWPLNIELTGSYHSLGDFSQAIAELPRIINFVDIDLQRVSQESSTLHFRVTAYAYQFKPGVEGEK